MIDDKETGHRAGKSFCQQVDTFMWALVLIWVGSVFFLKNSGWLDRIDLNLPLFGFNGNGFVSPWPIALAGAGLIFLLAAIILVATPECRNKFTGPLILAAVALGIGFGELVSWSLTGPFILIAIGLAMIIRNARK